MLEEEEEDKEDEEEEEEKEVKEEEEEIKEGDLTFFLPLFGLLRAPPGAVFMP